MSMQWPKIKKTPKINENWLHLCYCDASLLVKYSWGEIKQHYNQSKKNILASETMHLALFWSYILMDNGILNLNILQVAYFANPCLRQIALCY